MPKALESLPSSLSAFRLVAFPAVELQRLRTRSSVAVDNMQRRSSRDVACKLGYGRSRVVQGTEDEVASVGTERCRGHPEHHGKDYREAHKEHRDPPHPHHLGNYAPNHAAAPSVMERRRGDPCPKLRNEGSVAGGDESAMNLSGAQNYFWNFFSETAENFGELRQREVRRTSLPRR